MTTAHATPAFKVRATAIGYYGDARRRPGDVFVLTDPRHFSKRWMEQVSASTPDQRSTNQDVIRREHDAVLRERLTGRGRTQKPTGAGDPLGAGDPPGAGDPLGD